MTADPKPPVVIDPADLSCPAPIPEDDQQDLVPIESLLYRGKAALARASQLRDEMKQSGAHDQEALDELFDLIELARAE